MKRKLTTTDSLEKPKVVLAYSGGLDTSVILVWLVEKGYEVVCFCANVGQGEEDFEAVRAKAIKCGASKVYIEDLRHEFVKDFIFLAIKANAIYENKYLLGTSLARPCIARAQVKIAQLENARYLAHGATGKGNDQVRFELCALALDAELETIAPWRDLEFLENFKGRSDLLAYAYKNDIPVDASPKAPYSLDANLFHVSYESGILENPIESPTPDMFKMTVAPETAPDSPTFVRVEFDQGVPVKVVDKSNNHEISSPLELFLYLNKLAGENGIGRVDLVENRFVGIKSRGVYESPAATVLRIAHLDLEGLTMDREVMRIRDMMSSEFSKLCYNGFWFSPEFELVTNSINFSQRNISGSVELKFYKVMGRESPVSLYSSDLASMEIENGGKGLDYNPLDAQGFIKINAVRLRANRLLRTAIENN